MATQKPISTISYNTEAFLKEKLDIWINQHIIQAYQYIPHKGEDGDKDHIHVRVEPNKKLDPMELTELLKEYVPGNEKPLGCRPWRQSKEEDWFLYAVHDEQYLKTKYGGGEKGEKLPYNWEDIKVSDGYDLEIAFIRAKAKMKHTSANLVKRIQNGEKATNLIAEGENVFTVNALIRAVSGNDYERLHKGYSELYRDFGELLRAIEDFGLYAYKLDNGEYKLSSNPCENVGNPVTFDENEWSTLDDSPFDRS